MATTAISTMGEDSAGALGSADSARVAATASRPVLVVIMCAAMQAVGGGLGWSVTPALMPTIAKDLSLGHAASGFVFGAASLGIALASPFGGAAVDRWGARRVAGLAVLAGGFACAARALATSTL